MAQIKVPKSEFGNSSGLVSGWRRVWSHLDGILVWFKQRSPFLTATLGEYSSPWHSALRYDMRTISIPGQNKAYPIGRRVLGLLNAHFQLEPSGVDKPPGKSSEVLTSGAKSVGITDDLPAAHTPGVVYNCLYCITLCDSTKQSTSWHELCY